MERYCYNLHFEDEETKAQRGEAIFPKSRSMLTKARSQILGERKAALEPSLLGSACFGFFAFFLRRSRWVDGGG